MRRLLLPCLAAASFALLPATAALAQERSCECSDLPNLEDQLFLMEYLELLSRGFDKTDPTWDHYSDAGSSSHFKTILKDCGSVFWSTRNGVQVTDCTRADPGIGNDGSGNGEGSADASAATDPSDPSCGLRDGHDQPTTAKKYRDRPNQSGCKIDNDADLAHEAQHARTCKAAWASGHQKDFDNPSFFAADDARSYGVSVKVYRAEIAQLAKDCGWEGSSKPNRPDNSNRNKQPVKTVPTKDQAKALANAMKAAGGHK